MCFCLVLFPLFFESWKKNSGQQLINSYFTSFVLALLSLSGLSETKVYFSIFTACCCLIISWWRLNLTPASMLPALPLRFKQYTGATKVMHLASISQWEAWETASWLAASLPNYHEVEKNTEIIEKGNTVLEETYCQPVLVYLFILAKYQCIYFLCPFWPPADNAKSYFVKECLPTNTDIHMHATIWG